MVHSESDSQEEYVGLRFLVSEIYPWYKKEYCISGCFE